MQERQTSSAPNLFSPVEVGPLMLRNRIVMAPLTRSRAGPGNVPNQLNALYYAQQGYTDYPMLRGVAAHACYEHEAERAWG